MSTAQPTGYTCRSCKKQFDSLGDLQRHILVEHHQKGDMPSKSDRDAKAG
jgi:hypothetical protein